MASEWAMTTAIKLLDDEGGEIFQCKSGVLLLAETLDAAHKQGRLEGLEEAAKIAESHADHGDSVGDIKQDVCASLVANDVRARIEELQK